ncbi:MAG TPA: S4 domain-containing protein, partial [Polyangium sp.]|nr:S4 domain-containing protein [Polyangium sp.]
MRRPRPISPETTVAPAPPQVSPKEPFSRVVEATDPRDRLDKLVVRLCERVGVVTSRSAVQRWIEHGRVLVEGKPGQAASPVPLGAHVHVTPEGPEPTQAVPDASIALDVVY